MDSAEFISRREWNEDIVQLSTPVLRGVPITSGINRLSSENLLRAFHFADAADLECRLRRDVVPKVPFSIPTILSQVCHLWRELSISTPSLWTNIVVDDRTPLYSKSERDAHLFPSIDCFISLSKFQPLHITILLSGSHNNPSTFSICHGHYLANILFHNSERVKSLTMRGFSWKLQFATLKTLAGIPMPILETFNCDHGSGRNAEPPVYYIPDGNDDDNLPLFTSHASTNPLLRNLCLTSTPVVWNDFHVANLTTLVLAFLPDLPVIHDFRPPYETIHRILNGSRRTLRSLTLAGILICQQPLREALFRMRRPFPLSMLEDLHLAYEDPVEVTHFVVGISLPKLKRLDLVSLNRTEEGGSSIVAMFHTLIHAVPLEQLVYLKFHGVSLPISFDAIPSMTSEGYHIANVSTAQAEDQLEDDTSSEDDWGEAGESLEVPFSFAAIRSITNEGQHTADSLEDRNDRDDWDEPDEPFELPFTVSVSRWVPFDENVASELTVRFFDKLKALRTFEICEPDSATIRFLNLAMPDRSTRPVLPQLTAIRIAFVDDEFSDAVSTFLTARAARLDSDSNDRPPLLTKLILNGPQHSVSQISNLVSRLTTDRLGVKALIIIKNEESIKSGIPRTYRYTFSL